MDSTEINKQFAEHYRVKLHSNPNKPDKWGILHGEEIGAPGRYGEIAAPYKDGLLRMRLTCVPRNNATMNKALNSRAEQAQAAGMSLHQRNGYESVWLFDPANDAHCQLAIELIQPRRNDSRTAAGPRGSVGRSPYPATGWIAR